MWPITLADARSHGLSQEKIDQIQLHSTRRVLVIKGITQVFFSFFFFLSFFFFFSFFSHLFPFYWSQLFFFFFSSFSSLLFLILYFPLPRELLPENFSKLEIF